MDHQMFLNNLNAIDTAISKAAQRRERLAKMIADNDKKILAAKQQLRQLHHQAMSLVKEAKNTSEAMRVTNTIANRCAQVHSL